MIQSIKGRGTSSNPANRFHNLITTTDETEFESVQKPCTEVYEQSAKTVISRNNSPDVPHDQSVNPYAGCEHGCVYCYARPTHAYHDLSPGLDFETKIIAKTNAVDILEKEISSPSYKCKPILLGANTDPYQPIEKDYELTRKLLQLCLKKNQPVSLITKSALIERDMDVLSELASRGLSSVRMSITTLDNDLKRKLEPRTASGDSRLSTVSKLVAEGVPTGVLIAPVIPSINDHEIEAILTASKSAGATSANYILLRLPLEVKEMFQEWLTLHYPQRAKHVLSLIEQSRGGRLYNASFNQRMTGEGVFAEMIAKRFMNACRREGLKVDMTEKLNCSLFSIEAANHQMSLF